MWYLRAYVGDGATKHQQACNYMFDGSAKAPCRTMTQLEGYGTVGVSGMYKMLPAWKLLQLISFLVAGN